MSVVPFIPAHLDGFEPQDAQMSVMRLFDREDYVEQLALAGQTWTGIQDGKVMVIAGIVMIYEHIATAWAIFGKGSNRNMLRALRAMRLQLDECKAKRIETHILRDFKEGHRFANMLGFTNETPETGMINFGLDGETYDLYARYN